jgi:hypothetical protein
MPPFCEPHNAGTSTLSIPGTSAWWSHPAYRRCRQSSDGPRGSGCAVFSVSAGSRSACAPDDAARTHWRTCGNFSTRCRPTPQPSACWVRSTGGRACNGFAYVALPPATRTGLRGDDCALAPSSQPGDLAVRSACSRRYGARARQASMGGRNGQTTSGGRVPSSRRPRTSRSLSASRSRGVSSSPPPCAAFQQGSVVRVASFSAARRISSCAFRVCSVTPHITTSPLFVIPRLDGLR